ncbi:16S rRNA processing protein RimM [Deinococcus psychrotolerans]|uniref:Ribosome maturation factor RimM n=1 Tax=Deinococcus psychrotolerans TaxID=2489213 RepID=A0A3G8YE25_9DEIO|nr:ribosome maturation factor RimM [Deinococcus psychrotolerans]AZI43608.1 16S rRNA processing protein RimM [Deinococcus psychrotolerans]
MSAPNKSAPEQTTLVGTLLGPHGVAGAIKLQVIGSPQQLSKLKRLYIGELGWTRVLKFELHGAGPAITLGGILDRTAAAELRGRPVYAHDDELPALPEGEYYYHQLRGLEVKDAAGTVLGEVTDVLDAGHQDLLVVKSQRGGGLIPLQAPYVKINPGVGILLTEDAPLGLLGDGASEAEGEPLDGAGE